jgi:S1-C subfamily serine protease
MRYWSPAAALLLIALACNAQGNEPAPAPAAPAATAASDTTPLVPPPSKSARIEDEQNTIDVFKAAAAGTVFVTQTQLVMDRFSMKALEVPAGSGTGFVWDTKGHVVTNYHVVDGARALTVTLYDQTTWPATLVGGDPRKDVAVLKIEAPADKLNPIRVAPEDYEHQVGQKAIAIGNPFGLDHTLTTGVVSALGREVMGYGQVTIRDMIQTDASINPGNSGGPLLDSMGQLIGMNTMIFSQTGESAGIGFAVPVDTVRRVVTQVVEHGRVEQVGIGVQILDDRLARRIGAQGVPILEVVPDSPAAKAGLKGFTQTKRGYAVGDIIVAIDGKAVRSFDDLYGALDGRKAGDQVEVKYVRDGQEQTAKLPLVVVSEP